MGRSIPAQHPMKCWLQTTPWHRAALFGVSLGIHQLLVCYLWFQHTAILQVTITLHLQGHLIQIQPGKSSCETEVGTVG